MSECGVCIGSDGDGEYPEFSEITYPKARKEHRCEECGRAIVAGETYQKVAGKFDGEFYCDKTCCQCAEIRDAFSCGGGWPMPGSLWEEMRDAFPALNSSCFDRLATPEAKQFLRERWMKWKGLVA
jgi:hypothetical protein